jgi:hypothetical protein
MGTFRKNTQAQFNLAANAHTRSEARNYITGLVCLLKDGCIGQSHLLKQQNRHKYDRKLRKEDGFMQLRVTSREIVYLCLSKERNVETVDERPVENVY